MRLALAVLLLAAAQVQPPPRDAAPAPPPQQTGAGVIRGRVVAADNGVPVRRAIVSVSGASLARGAALTVYTDARGRYEVRNLPPGAYVVRVSPNQYQGQFLTPPPPPVTPEGPPRVSVGAGQVVSDYDLTLPRAGAIAGRLVDEDGDPISGVYVTAQRIGDRPGMSDVSSVPSDELGRYRLFRLTPGDYLVIAKPGGAGDYVGEGQPAIGFVETYHPGTLSREGAARVRVRAGQETAAGDIALTHARMLRVKGMALDSSGAPAGSGTMVTLAREGGGSIGVGLSTGGRFSFRPQQPGKYRLIARLQDDSGESALEYANVPLTLLDTDDDDIVVSMTPTATVSGRVVFDGAQAPSLTPDSLTIRTTTKSVASSMELPVRLAPLATDLSFTLRRIAGERLVRPNIVTRTEWVLKAVLLGTTDITDVPTEFRDADSGRLQVVLTNRWSEIAGTVTNDKGDPVAGAQIVLFSEDKSAWFATATRFRIDVSAPNGRYSLKGLRGGRYYLVALPRDRAISDLSIETATFELLAAEASTVFIGDEESRQVDLRLALASAKF